MAILPTTHDFGKISTTKLEFFAENGDRDHKEMVAEILFLRNQLGEANKERTSLAKMIAKLKSEITALKQDIRDYKTTLSKKELTWYDDYPRNVPIKRIEPVKAPLYKRKKYENGPEIIYMDDGEK